MKPPKCRLCHKEHYGQCKAGDFVDAVIEGASALPPEPPLHVQMSLKQDRAPQPKPKIDKRFSKSLAVGLSEVQTITPDGLTTTDTIVVTEEEMAEDIKSGRASFTNAEKQKAYRKRLKADPAKWLAHLEADRERKRMK